MITTYISIGSNLSNPVQQVKIALLGLSRLHYSQLVRQSRLYRSKPLGPADQPDFINAVCAVRTMLSPHELLLSLQNQERAQGRKRSKERWGPRTIDLDILLYGNEIIDEENLRIPHPGLFSREFVLYPLAEIAQDLILPSGESILTLRDRCPSNGIECLEEGMVADVKNCGISRNF